MDWTIDNGWFIITLISVGLGILSNIDRLLIKPIANLIKKRKELESQKTSISFINREGKVSHTRKENHPNEPTELTDIFFTFDVKNKSNTDETTVIINNAELKVIGNDDKEYFFEPLARDGNKADFINTPLKIPKIPAKKSQNSHITFRYTNLPTIFKKGFVRIEYSFIDRDDTTINDKTEWLDINLRFPKQQNRVLLKTVKSDFG